jgi:ATP-dependent Clp protease protease subunit
MGRQRDAHASKEKISSNQEFADQYFSQQQPDLSTRIVILHGDVNEHSISNVIIQLLHLATINHDPINLIVSTYGGSVDEMFSLYDTIKFLPCEVHTVALGKVMSAGVLLLASGVKGKRLIGSSARIMIHPVSGGSYGNVFEIENESNESRRLHNLMIDALVKETKIKKSEITKMMETGRDHYLTPQDAIRLGIVDKIIGSDK